MILTVTLNPSVDISYKLDGFQLNNVNRVADVTKTVGGKGLNVARVLRQLNEEVSATGFLGGNLGQYIRDGLKTYGVEDYFVQCAGETRNCIAVIHEAQQTEILEGGPTITEEKDSFLSKFKETVQHASIVTISGSLPKGLRADFYNELLAIARQNNTPVLLDTSGESLRLALVSENPPFLIKPNKEELSALLDIPLETEEKVTQSLSNPIFQGVKWLVVTLGAEGSIVKHEERIYRVTIPAVEAVNPVGSGDAVIAGFASGLARGLSEKELIKFGIKMGLLNALEEKTGTIDLQKAELFRDQITVEQVHSNEI